MYTCYTKQERFETYVLENKQTQTYMEVVPERGGIISKYVENNEQIFYLEQDTLDNPDQHVRGGNPILFPISSYITNETYYYEGKPYQLKQHGFVRSMASKVIETVADETSASITLEFVDNEETLVRYPFHFKLILTYTLNEQGLTITGTVHNTDHKVMPFYLGHHPYLYVEDKDQVEIQVPSSNCEILLTDSMVGDQFNLNVAESNVIYNQLQSKSSSLIDHARNLKITVTSDEVFQYIVLWSLQGKPFVCIEPWMAPVDGLNLGIGIQQLEAGQTHTSTIVIQSERV